MANLFQLHVNGEPEKIDKLSERERQVLVLAANGHTDKSIGNQLELSEATIATYWGRLRIKLGPFSRGELISILVAAEMKRSALIVEELRDRLELLMRLSPVGVGLYVNDLGYVYCNTAFRRILGLSESDEISPQILINSAIEEDRPLMMEICNATLTHVEDKFVIVRVICPHAVFKVLRIQVSRNQLFEGIQARAVVMEDITLEEAGKVAQAQLMAALNTVPVGVIFVDESGKYQYFNDEFRRISGAVSDNFTVVNGELLLHPDDRNRVMQIWRKCVAEGLDYESEHRYLRPDGTTVWVHAKGHSWLKDGQKCGMVVSIEDVTTKLQLQSEKEEESKKYRTLFELSSDSILFFDEALNVVEANKASGELFGYSPSELIGKSQSELLPPGLADTHGQLMKQFGRGMDPTSRPMNARKAVQGIRKDGELFHCRASISRQHFKGKLLYAAILREEPLSDSHPDSTSRDYDLKAAYPVDFPSNKANDNRETLFDDDHLA